MPDKPLHTMLHQLRRLVTQEGAGNLTDAQLLEHFVAGRDELAFEVLLWRHGAMVLDVCRRVLRHTQDAEDAFQATFLILVRKAGSIGKRESVGSWLYKVAYRVACAARGMAGKQIGGELSSGKAAAVDPAQAALWRDLAPVLDEEVNRLPDKYRVPVVLCYLQSKTVEEAARQLGCPRGTVGTRLARARQRLRTRLAGRGLTLGTAALVALLAQTKTHAAVPAALVAATLRAATGPATAFPAHVFALTEGVLKAMFLTKLKIAAAVALVVAAFSTGLGSLSYRTQAAEEPGAPQDARPPIRVQKADPPRKVVLDSPFCTSCHDMPVHHAGQPKQARGVAVGDFDNDGKLDLFVANDRGDLMFSHGYSLALLHKPGARLALRGWGVAIDPDGECKFSVEKGRMTIALPGKDHALAVERGQMNAPRVLQEVDGDFIVQVKVSADFPLGTKSVVEGRRPFHGAGLLVFQDAKNFVRLESAGMVYEDKDYRYASFELRQAGKFVREGEAHEHRMRPAKHVERDC